MLNKRLEKLVKENKYVMNVVSCTPNDIATVTLQNNAKTAYLSLVYIGSKYRLYSLSLDIVPSSIYDDLPNHDDESMSIREDSILKNVSAYLDNQMTIYTAKYMFFSYKYILLDRDGVITKMGISK